MQRCSSPYAAAMRLQSEQQRGLMMRCGCIPATCSPCPCRATGWAYMAKTHQQTMAGQCPRVCISQLGGMPALHSERPPAPRPLQQLAAAMCMRVPVHKLPQQQSSSHYLGRSLGELAL